jgi:hypothetical protein
MNLEAVFQYSIYSLMALAGVILAYGEEAFFPSGLTVVLSLAALFFTERHYKFHIPTLVANGLALVVVCVVVAEFRGERADARLLAGAHFLVYVTWILLFQAKEIRHYWWMCALSLLQVALGPLLTLSSGWYGFLLFLYLVLAIWTLSVFTLYQGAIEFGAIAEAPDRRQSRRTAAGQRSAGYTDRLAALRQAFSRGRRSAVQNSIQQDSPGRWIVPRFIVGVMGLSFSGLALGLALFLFVPRVWIGSGLRSVGDGARSTPSVTGFSDEVRLGQIGQILESTDRVMQVELFDHFTDEPVYAERLAQKLGLSAPLFRGNVLEEYKNGRWFAGSRAERSSTLEAWPREPGIVRQEYTLEMRGSDVLFAIQPVALAVMDPPQPVSQEVDSEVLFAPEDGRDVVKYRVFSHASGSGSAPRSPDRGRLWRRSGVSPRSLEPPAGLDRLTALAREVTAAEKLPPDDGPSRDRQIALALEAHLRDSGLYDYSLNMAVSDPESDAVEDFLFNRRRGHCEYFASALTLMLRAEQIPARLVTGFKGAQPLAGSGVYEVQQRHAHAWVEAFVDDRWIVLDPTPAARDEYVRDVAARIGFWKNAGNSISSFWSTYVVSLSLNRQQQVLYDPLQGSANNGWGSVRNALTHVASAAGRFKDTLFSPERLFTPGGAAIVLTVLALAFILYNAARRYWNREPGLRVPGRRQGLIGRMIAWLRELMAARAPDSARIVIAFYEQFQALVAARGFAPRRDQTQREFALQVEQSLAERLEPAGLHRFPSELTELFYRVRFGNGSLQAAEVEGLDRRLEYLKQSLLPGARVSRK